MFKKTLFAVGYLVLCTAILIASPALAVKDSLVVAVDGKFPSLDPNVSTHTNLNRLWESLNGPVLYRDSETREIVHERSLITSFKLIDDVTWDFTLRKDVRFHNGSPLTAHDFKFSLEKVILDPARKSRQRTRNKMLKEIQVVDDYHFRVITHGPYAMIVDRIANLRIFDEETVAKHGWDWMQENANGTGAYKVTEWIKGQSLAIEANEDYFLKGKGSPKIKTVVFRVIPEYATRIAELRAGNVDLIYDVEADKTKQVTNSDELKLLGGPIPRLVFYQFDAMGRAGESPVQDIRVRKAIWHALDREAIAGKLLRGHATVVDTWSTPFLFGYDASIKGLEYNPEKAKALLKEAGYENGITLNVWQYSAPQNLFNKAAAGYLAAVGIKINIKDYRGNIGQAVKLRNSGKITDIGNFGWGTASIFDNGQFHTLWLIKDNKKKYNDDKDLEKWVEEASNTLDMDRRKELFSKVQKRIREKVYFIPLFVKHELWGAKKDLEVNLPSWGDPRYYDMEWKK